MVSFDFSPLVLLVSANDKRSYLSNSLKEINELDEILSPICLRSGYELKIKYYSAISDLIDLLNNNKKRLLIIHFSGHSASDFLKLDEGELYANGLDKILASCSQLQLIFLNSCNNVEQVRVFSNIGLGNIIGTNQLIDDSDAKKFSLTF